MQTKKNEQEVAINTSLVEEAKVDLSAEDSDAEFARAHQVNYPFRVIW